MRSYDSTTLADYPYVVVRVACSLCPRRHGVYRLARLAAKFGFEMPLDVVLHHIAFDCPWREEPARRSGNQYIPKCHAHFPDLKGPRPPDLPPGHEHAKGHPRREGLTLARLHRDHGMTRDALRRSNSSRKASSVA